MPLLAPQRFLSSNHLLSTKKAQCCSRCNTKFSIFTRWAYNCNLCGLVCCDECAPVFVSPLRFCSECCKSRTAECFGLILERQPADHVLWGVVAEKLKENQQVCVREVLSSSTCDQIEASLLTRRGKSSSEDIYKKFASMRTRQLQHLAEDFCEARCCKSMHVQLHPDCEIIQGDPYYLFYKGDSLNRSSGAQTAETAPFIVCRYYDAVQCYVHSIEMHMSVRHWGDLARVMKPNVVVTIRVSESSFVRFSKLDCYKNALFGNPKSSVTWSNLGIDLSPVELVDIEGKKFNKERCFLKSIELGGSAAAWSNLGFHLAATKRTCVMLGQILDYKKCFAKAIEMQPHYAVAWSNLASALPEDVEVEVSGVLRTRRDCAIKAVELDETRCQSWFNLACMLSDPQEKVTVKKKEYNKRRLFEFILKNNLHLTSVKIRTQLMLMFPDHPVFLQYHKEFVFDNTEENIIGRGAQGCVYRGKHLLPGDTAEIVAVKESRLHRTESAGASDCEALTEVQLMVDDKFASIVIQCFHVDFLRDTSLLWMELAEGSLQDIVDGNVVQTPDGGFRRVTAAAVAHSGLKIERNPEEDVDEEEEDESHLQFSPLLRGPLQESDVRRFAGAVIHHLTLLHHHNVIHGDIKPQNILVFRDGSLKLADFGLSKILKKRAGVDEGSGLSGSVRFAPKDSIVSTAFDIYCFAATIVHLTSENGIEISPESGLPIIPTQLSSQMKEILSLCFHVEPAERISAKQISEQYGQFFAGRAFISTKYADPDSTAYFVSTRASTSQSFLQETQETVDSRSSIGEGLHLRLE